MALDPLSQIHPVTIAGVIVIFFFTYLLLRRMVFLPLIDVMERRTARIAAALASEAEAKALLADAQREAEEARSRAAVQVDAVVSRIKQETAERHQARMASANRQAEAILAKGRDEVRDLVRAESERLRDELIACATATLRRVTGSVDETALRFTVNRVLTEQEAR